MSEPTPEVSSRLRTPANALTALRLLLVPVLVVLLVGEDDPPLGRRLAALAVFALASATDQLDGMLARRRGEVTRFGVMADPIADKALLLAVFGCVAWLGELSWWAVGVVAAREVYVTGLRLAVLRRGRLVPAATSGKVKTVLQVVTAAVLLLPGVLGPVEAVLVLLMVVVTVVSGLEILVRIVFFGARA